MYNYDEVYERIIENTQSVNLPAEESIKIVNKVYNDLEVGLLKPRNITKKTQKLICNSLARQNKQKENLTIEYYQVHSFLEEMKPKLTLSDDELETLEKRLLDLNLVNAETLNRSLRKYLNEIGNDSLKMIKNQSFRDLDQSIISIDSGKIANKYGLYDERLMFYGFIDHYEGLMFELLTDENNQNYILPKSELDGEVIVYIDREDIELDKYRDLRNLKQIDEFRDSTNPDVITVKFVDGGRFEYLKVRLEAIVGSKLIATLIEEPKKLPNIHVGDEVVVNYCYDYTDKIHVYVNGAADNMAVILRELESELRNASREAILEKLAHYKNNPNLEMIIDTFHSIIFDYFRDINEFYRDLNEVNACI